MAKCKALTGLVVKGLKILIMMIMMMDCSAEFTVPRVITYSLDLDLHSPSLSLSELLSRLQRSQTHLV